MRKPESGRARVGAVILVTTICGALLSGLTVTSSAGGRYAIGVAPASAAVTHTITVNTLSDESTAGDGLCSLREAINNANSPGVDTTGGDCVVGSGGDAIDFSITGTITLSGPLPAIQNILTIDAANPAITNGPTAMIRLSS